MSVEMCIVCFFLAGILGRGVKVGGIVVELEEYVM